MKPTNIIWNEIAKSFLVHQPIFLYNPQTSQGVLAIKLSPNLIVFEDGRFTENVKSLELQYTHWSYCNPQLEYLNVINKNEY